MDSTRVLQTRSNRIRFQVNPRVLVVICTLLFVQTACSESTPYDELVKHGFYAYTISSDMLSKQNWSLITPIKEGQWDLHCKDGPSAPENPLILNYLDENGNLQLSIWISSRGSMWDHNYPTENVTLTTPWSIDGLGEVYKDELHSPLKYEDVFGNKVVVRGRQTVTEKINLVNQFEYVGPSEKGLINPWSLEWCARN